jgi:hypothetical protein
MRVLLPIRLGVRAGSLAEGTAGVEVRSKI